MSTFISLDLETTGVNPEKDKIIEFGAVKFDLEGYRENLTFLINPGVTLPQIITHITRLTDKDLQNQHAISDKIEEIKNFIGDSPIIGHNIKFDTSFIRNNGIDLQNKEYDTYNLASILIPNLPSYSLEILSQLLNLKHREKHRALEDAIAAMELFIKLTEILKSLPQETIKEIKEIASKSNWALKDLILGLDTSISTENPKVSIKKEKTKKGKVEITEETKKITQVISKTSTSTLFEIIPPYENLTKELLNNSNADTYICVSNEIFRNISSDINSNIAQLDTPKNYLSLKRLEQFKSKPFYQEHEATALIKYLIWSKETETGLLKEVNVFGQEKSTLQHVNADKDFTDPNEEFFVKKALQKDKNSPALCTYEYLMDFRPPQIKNLVIVDFEKFARDLFYHTSEKITIDSLLNPLTTLKEIYPENHTLESLISKSTILFGLFGVFYDKYNNKDAYTPRVIIDKNSLLLKEWSEIKSLINNLVAISTELKEINNEFSLGFLKKWKQNLILLKDIFEDTNLENNLIVFDKDYNQNILIQKTPKTLKHKLEELFSLCTKFSIIDECLDIADDGAFIKNFYGFEEGITITSVAGKREDLLIQLVKSEENQLNHILKTIKEKKGKTAIIFNSKQQLEFFTLKLSKPLYEEKINVISQLTGSIGKMEEKFNQDPENSVVLLTVNVWEKFKYTNQIETLIVQKVPFEAPGNIFLFSLSQSFNNAFNEFQVPRAVIATKKIINHLTASNATAIFLDTRIYEKDYCKAILKTLQTLGSTELI